MKVIIIGGVAAGMSCASKIKRMDQTAEVVVYEKGGFLSYGACGLPYYIGDFNNDYRKMIARTKEQFEEAGIVCHLFHEVLTVDSTKKRVCIKNKTTNEEFYDTYDKLMIATGATAIMPPLEGSHLIGVHTVKTLEEGIFLREYAKEDRVKNVVIVGGGYIGIECAEAFLHLGKQVRIIEATTRILTPFDEEIAELAQKELSNQGVSIHVNEKVTRFYGNQTIKQVETTFGIYPADLVIMAVGIKPATSFLSNPSFKKAKNGAFIVNQKMETSVPDIYAAGDCAVVYHKELEANVYLALGTNANKCGRIAGINIVGGHREFAGALGSAAIKVCSLELARTGISENEAINNHLPYKTVIVQTQDHPTYYPDPTPLVIKLIYHAKSRKLLGAQICGKKGAVLRIDVFAVAIHAGMTCDDLGMLDLAYAPPFASVWDAIHIACNAAK